jgi:uncharacterized phiE125 gp8 family phage protein
MLTSISYNPSVCPVTTQYLRQHTRISNTYDDNMLTQYATVATEMVEHYLSRFLLTQDVVWTVARDQHQNIGASVSWMMPWQWSAITGHNIVTLPRPTTAVNSVTIGLWGETPLVMVEGTDYLVDTTAAVGRIKWLSNAFSNAEKNYLQVDFTTGFSAGIPAPILHAICLLVTNLYEERGDRPSGVWTPAIESLLAPYRFLYFG